jgi:hypothetical protein
MNLTGHKTDAVYRRYAVDSTMLQEAVGKLGALYAAEANYPSSIRVSPFRGETQGGRASILSYFAVLLGARESGGMADALDLGSSAARRGGSSPPSRIKRFLDRQSSPTSRLSVFCPSSARVRASASNNVAALTQCSISGCAIFTTTLFSRPLGFLAT